MSEEIKQLSTEQLQDLIEFAAQINGTFSPYLSNTLFKKTPGNKYNATVDEVKAAIEAGDSQILTAYSLFQKSYSALFNKIVKQYSSYIKWNVIPTCINATFADYATPEFAADKARLNNFLDQFPYQDQFQRILEMLFTNEVVYFNVRKRRNKYAIQILPQDYCMIVGESEYGYQYCFDLNYFNQSGVDINSFPAFFKTALANPEPYLYKPSASQSRFRGRYCQWIACPPAAGFYCVKLQPANMDTIPFFSSALKDIVNEDTIRELQNNKNIISAFAILSGEIGVFENQKTLKADATKFNPRTLGSFLSKARQGLDETMHLAALPLENIKLHQYKDDNPDLVVSEADTAASSGSFVGSVIIDKDKQNIKTISLAQIALESIAENTRPQFENIMNIIGQQATRKFKWTFNFVGSKNTEIEKSRIDNYFRLMDKGIVLPPAYFASVIDVPPQVFERSLEESKAMNWIEQFSQVAKSIYTQTTNASNDERSLKPDTEIADESAQSREARGVDSTIRTTTEF